MRVFILALVAAAAVGCSDATNPAAPSAVPGGSTDVVNPYNADHGGRSLIANLSGTGGTGTLHLSANNGQSEFCYSLETTATYSTMHLHRGPTESVMTLVMPTTHPWNCLDNLDRGLVKDVLRSPGSYYVVLHGSGEVVVMAGALEAHSQPYDR